MHAWGWKDICRPKREGGLGIRKLMDINNASGMRMLWRLHASQSLWAQWMKLHYLKEEHISQAKAAILSQVLGSRSAI